MSDDSTEQSGMSSSRPYLLRAMYDWVSDNDLTPYVLVDAGMPGVQVPPHTVSNGQVVLNLAMQAVANLDLGDHWVSFKARFGGVSQTVYFPVAATLAIYAKENGQGMMFADEDSGIDAPQPPDSEPDGDGTPSDPDDDSGNKLRKSGAPHLRVIK